MRNKFWLLTSLLCTLFISCENDNIEQKYYQPITLSDTSNIKNGQIAYFPFNGTLNDTTNNNTNIFMVGSPEYVNGLNPDYKQGLRLDGQSYLMIKIGYYDTISVVMWIKGDRELNGINKPVLFDYGLNAISTQLDASTGATMLTSTKNEHNISSTNSSIKYLNSYNRYSFLYFESTGDKTKVIFKGYAKDGTATTYKQNLNIPGITLPQSELLYIGHTSLRDDNNSTNFRGAIDELQVFNCPLSDIEIETLANIYTN